jgi:hypothetical protein
MADTELSEYVEFGLRSSYPGPFLCRQAHMRMLVLEGDSDAISHLVRRTLDEPAGPAIAYRPVSSKVILLYGLNVVSSMTPPWDSYGRVNEVLASFWVPVWAGRERDGEFIAERLCMTIPHILVDNPMSHLAGREIYGFAKALGRFDYRDGGEDPSGPVRIEGYGGRHGPDEVAGWHPLIDAAPVAGAEAAVPEELDGFSALVDAIAPEVLPEMGTGAAAAAAEGFELPGSIRVALSACRNLRRGLMDLVFCKQFRDAVHHRQACYQRVVEAPSRTIESRASLSRGDWEFTLHALDSHPIGAELGIASGTQRLGWSVEMTEFEFEVLPGRVVGPLP